jgi:hypothetical protein
VAQEVEYLPNSHKALSSNSNTAKKKKKMKRTEKGLFTMKLGAI